MPRPPPLPVLGNALTILWGSGTLVRQSSASRVGSTTLINSHGCQIGLSCGLLALNHELRSLIPAAAPVTLAMFAAVTGATAGENFDLLDLLTFAQSSGLGEPLPARRPRAAYLLHSPGHFLALTPTRLGYLLCGLPPSPALHTHTCGTGKFAQPLPFYAVAISPR